MKRRGQASCRTRACSFPRKRKSFRGVLLWWPVLHVLITLLSHLDQAELFGTCWVGHSSRKQQGLGYGCSEETSKGRFFSSLDAVGDWVKKGSYRTAWSVPCDSSCTCSFAYGRGPAKGPHTGKRCWPLLAGVCRAIAPLLKPWCAEGEVPTTANLNLYRGWRSCVGWHCDDEPLFGEYGDAKLIVSVSLGDSVVFRWRRQSCLDDEGHLCCLGHGDVLVMDGRCRDKFLHHTDTCREQERINITFLWIKQHASSCPLFKAGVACCLPTCAQGSPVPVMGNVVSDVFWACWFLLGALYIWKVLVLLVSLFCTRLGFHWCAYCWTRPLDEGRSGHYLCNLWGECLTAHKSRYLWFHEYFMKGESPWLLCMYGLLNSWSTSEKLQAKTT